MGVARFEGVWGGDNGWLENISNDFLGVITVFGDTGEAFGMGYVVSDESEHLT